MMHDFHGACAVTIQCHTEQRAANVVSHDLWFWFFQVQQWAFHDWGAFMLSNFPIFSRDDL